MRISRRVWDLVPIVARLCQGGNGEPGQEIFRRMTGNLGYRRRESAQAMREYGYNVERLGRDYRVSPGTAHFPSPMKLEDNDEE